MSPRCPKDIIIERINGVKISKSGCYLLDIHQHTITQRAPVGAKKHGVCNAICLAHIGRVMILVAVSRENQPRGARNTLASTYKARSNIGKLTLGSGYNSSWYIWSWGVSDSGPEQVIAKRQKMLLSRSTGVRALTQKNAPLDCFVLQRLQTFYCQVFVEQQKKG